MSLSPENPANESAFKPMRLAAVGDLHVGENAERPYRELFARISQEADVLALCGDLTNFGKTREAEILAEDLQVCTIGDRRPGGPRLRMRPAVGGLAHPA